MAGTAKPNWPGTHNYAERDCALIEALSAFDAFPCPLPSLEKGSTHLATLRADEIIAPSKSSRQTEDAKPVLNPPYRSPRPVTSV